jgi:methyl-accepting chemotaxis protein
MLPTIAALVFALGIAVVLAVSSRTSTTLSAVGTLHYPYLDATSAAQNQFKAFHIALQAGVAEGEKKRVEDALAQGVKLRELIQGIGALPGKTTQAQTLLADYDAYVAIVSEASAIMLGSKQGDEAAAGKKFQAGHAKFADLLAKTRDDARTQFNGQLDAARSSTQSTLAVILGVAVVVVLGLGLGSRWVIGKLWRQLGGEPEYVRDVVQQVARGDLSCQIKVLPHAKGSLLEAMKDMVMRLREMVGVVQSGTSAITRASHEIAGGSMDLSHRTVAQAGELQQTASSMQQMTDALEQSAGVAQRANQLAISASRVAAQGGAVVGRVVNTMAGISQASRKIGDIIGVIDGIAFQTNILALNAAVESARAGEQGRGFAVVANEVRNLAQRSSQAAREIKQLISDSMEQVDSGSKLVGEAGTTMNEIVQQVQHVSSLIAEINVATAAQTISVSQVNRSVSSLDQGTQQNAALAEQSAAASDELKMQANELMNGVEAFKL